MTLHPFRSPRAFLPPMALAIALAAPGFLSVAAPTGAEPVPPAGSLRVVFFSDIHARTEWDTPEALHMAAQAINAQQADVVICGGDMITDGYTSSADMVASRWEVYRAFHDAIRPAPVSVIGNHDLVGVEPADGSPPAEDPRAEVRAWMNLPQTYRSFAHGGYHFILLDSIEVTTDEHKYRGYIGPEQMEWLRNDLTQVAPHTPVVVVTHIPLATGFFQAPDGTETEPPPSRVVVNHHEVLDALSGHRLLAVLQGHLHVAEEFQRNGISFITSGAVCGRWWRGPWQGTPEGFVVLTLHPDRVEWEYQTYGWTSRRPPGE